MENCVIVNNPLPVQQIAIWRLKKQNVENQLLFRLLDTHQLRSSSSEARLWACESIFIYLITIKDVGRLAEFSFGKGGKAFGVQRRKCVAAMVERWCRQRLRKPRVSGLLRSLGKGRKAGRADHLRQK